jgi:FtsP/CotA-like multicopper oxidase with cupredoxin domain
MLSRRHFLIGSPGAVAALAARARAETGPDGFIVLRAAPGQARLFGPDRPPVPVWGFGGAVPGPVIRVRRGEEVKLRLVNGLNEPTAIHWHGVRLANPMDGAPPLTQAPVAPGASFDYRFVVPDAGTFWYRAHLPHQQERGLYGALIVEEPAPPPVDRDRVVVFADWQTIDGKLDEAPRAQRDAQGAAGGSGQSGHFTVNGAPSLDIAVRTHERLRLRFVNASAMRVMRARIDGHRVLVMALDGQPAEPFVARDGVVVLGPGNRADVFIDAVREPGSIAPVTFEHDGGETVLARLIYESSGPARAAPPGEPKPLPANSLPARMNFSRALRVTLPIESGTGIIGGNVAIGGKVAAGGGPPLFTAERGRTVVMALENRSTAHAVHLHGHHVRLLDRLDDGWKPYWLDTVLVRERETARIAFVADNPGRWLIEQHALDRPAAATAWFGVT